MCPATLPATGTACNRENLECEYGDATWNVACDAVVQCQNGQWWSYEASYDTCTPKPGKNPASCPASYASIPQGQACDASGLSCAYDEGARAAARRSSSVRSRPTAGAPPSGRATRGKGAPHRARVSGARARRSRGTTCEYVTCGYAQTCSDGVWQATQEECDVEGAYP